MYFCFLPVSADAEIFAETYVSIGAALDAIPEKAGNVLLYVSKEGFTVEDAGIEIPTDRGITGITILPEKNLDTVSLPGIVRICANGISFTVEQGVIMENASLYGGACVSEGDASLPESDILLNGSAAFVFGGGFAENGGHSTVGETSVTIGENALVYYEVFGGGHAYGEGSLADCAETSVLINGTVDYALGGGYGEDGGESQCGQTSLTVAKTGKTAVAMFSGGSAAGDGSLSVVENANAILEGTAELAFSGDFAWNGGKTRTEGATRLEIFAAGAAEDAYMGSFASDEGSVAFVNTSELMNCGSVSELFRRGQASDGAKSETLIPALFPCNL